MRKDIATPDLNIWKAGMGKFQGLYACKICIDGVWRNGKNCARHILSKKHQSAEKFHKSNRALAYQPERYDGLLNFDINLIPDNEDTSLYNHVSHIESNIQDPVVYDDNHLETDLFGMENEMSQSLNDDDKDNSSSENMNIDEDEDLLNAEVNWISEGLQVEGGTYSDDEPEFIEDDERTSIVNNKNICSSSVLNSLSMTDDSSDWFPWPNKLYCVLDIFRNLPRSTLSEKQHGLILWGLRTLGISNVPSESTVKSVIDSIQYMCGVKTIRYIGALGHVYYVNDLSALIAQEMANPKVRKYVEVYPEDAGDVLQHAYQGRRWLHELEADLLTPMVRRGDQDFYSFEPAILRDGSVAMPVRWFKYRKRHYAFAWPVLPSSDSSAGWFVHQYEIMRIPVSDFSVSFPYFCDSYHYRGFPDPRNILGVYEKASEDPKPWNRTNPTEGNKWRKLSKGHCVYAFPIWLYCDDTSGNLSKKWNGHNSYLFTPAGLPQEYLHRQYNVHFLCTSNIAPPLEMLEGIVDQLTCAQNSGIWAWDHSAEDRVLLIPSVLGLLGDNPMQSEFACHVGLKGNLFCRTCMVSGVVKANNTQENAGGNGNCDQSERASIRSDTSQQSAQDDRESVSASIDTVETSDTEQNRALAPKTMKMSDWVKRAEAFLKIDTYRYKEKTLSDLSEIFKEVLKIRGKSRSQKLKTKYGVKDKYQEHFSHLIFDFSSKLRGADSTKQKHLDEYVKTLPKNMVSPVWRIRDIDPHKDTPVELLHVVLLGYAKYLWRDAIARLNDAAKQQLIIRLNSVNTLGLNLSPLAGKTLVQYSGSLTGRDFRALLQVSPFVLYDMIPSPCFRAWIALSFLAPLLWQPAIYQIEDYSVKLQNAIDYFLLCIAAWTPRWFNKPKFHLLLHLVEHILRFGPPHTFATETFESYNSFIRDLSVHSNRQAPSRDIAYGFANANRIRHLVSGGKFLFQEDTTAKDSSMHAIYLDSKSLEPSRLKSVGPKVLELFEQDTILRQLCGYLVEDQMPTKTDRSLEVKSGQISWVKTFSSQVVPQNSASQAGLDQNRYRICKSCRLKSEDECNIGQFVVVQGTGASTFAIGKIVEMLQVYNSIAELERRPSLVLISLYSTSTTDNVFLMPTLKCSGRYSLLEFNDLLCTANTQHNCAKNKCPMVSTKRVRQEREKTQTLELELNHLNPEDLLLNCAQMRSSHYIQQFHTAPVPINRDIAIYEGAAREIEIQRSKETQKGKGKETAKAKDGTKAKKNTKAHMKSTNGAQRAASNARAQEGVNSSAGTTAPERQEGFLHSNNASTYAHLQSLSDGEARRNFSAQAGYQYTSRAHIPFSPSAQYLGESWPSSQIAGSSSQPYSAGSGPSVNHIVPNNRPLMYATPMGSTASLSLQRPSALGPIMNRLGIRRNRQ